MWHFKHTKTHPRQHGFTIVELMVVAPVVILTIGAFVTVIIGLTGDVLASRASNTALYNIQDGLNRMEQDIKLSSSFLATNNITPQPGQGFDNNTAGFKNVDATNGTMLILNSIATTGNPIQAGTNYVYAIDPLNACNSAQVIQNTPQSMNVIYFVKAGTLWRRVVMQQNYANTTTAWCSAPWQEPSCSPGYVASFCKTQDIQIVSGLGTTGFNVQYYTGANNSLQNTTASDTAATDTNRAAALVSCTTATISLTTNQTVAGRTVTQAGSIRATRLDINASSIYTPPTPTIPAAPVITASVTAPTTAVFTWPAVQGATGYTLDYEIGSGSWVNAANSGNPQATTFSVSAPHNSVVSVRTSTYNSAGTSTATSNSIASITIPLWATPVLQNGWTNYGGWTTAGFTKTTSGLVLVKGLVKGGTGTIAVLPVGYRPAERLVFLTSTSPNAAGRVDVDTNGAISILAGSNTWIALDNIRFMPSGTSFITPTLASGWLNYGTPYAAAGYMIDPSGRVQIKGLIQSGAVGSIFSLPANAATAENAYMGVYTNNGFGDISARPAGGGQDIYYVNFPAGSGYVDIQTMYYPAGYSGWTNLTLQNSWAYYGSPFTVPAYTKGSDNVVTVKGFVKAGAAATVIATLPAGDRPAQSIIFAQAAYDAYARVDVQPNGNIVAQSFASNGWLSIDNINFVAEQ